MKNNEILRSGKARFTLVDTKKGRRWSFQVTKLKPRREWFYAQPNPPYAVGVLTGSDNTRHYTYLGMLQQPQSSEAVKLTGKSKMPADAVPVRAANWALKLMMNELDGVITKSGFEVKWANTCARCGKVLTVPSSIDNRLGPECAKMCS